MATSRKPTTEELAEQSRAIRAFFTEPKDTYTEAEILRLFAGERPDEFSNDRATVGGFLCAFVSPGIVGRACAGTESEVSLDAVTVELPRWLVKALRRAEEVQHGESIGDVIATRLRDAIGDDGFLSEAGVRLPKYGALVTSPAEQDALNREIHLRLRENLADFLQEETDKETYTFEELCQLLGAEYYEVGRFIEAAGGDDREVVTRAIAERIVINVYGLPGYSLDDTVRRVALAIDPPAPLVTMVPLRADLSEFLLARLELAAGLKHMTVGAYLENELEELTYSVLPEEQVFSLEDKYPGYIEADKFCLHGDRGKAAKEARKAYEMRCRKQASAERSAS